MATNGYCIQSGGALTFDSATSAVGAFAIDASGNLAVNTNKFTVTAASGNTLVGGTLSVTGAATLSSTLASGALTVTGAATVSTTLGVTGATTLSSTLAAGATTVTGAITATTSITSSGATNGVGYATGAGGAVTQITSRTTGVTLNKVTGAITLVSAAGSATAATFTVTNSAVVATDVIILSQKSGTDKIVAVVTAVAAGSFDITFFTTGGTTTETPVINFAVLKAVAA